jgi:hypothetical protein
MPNIPGQKRFTALKEPWAPRPISMLESPANRVLSLSAKRVLERVEIELARHAGHDNGRLPVTYGQFEEFGIERHAIAKAIRECCALGFLQITEAGRSGNGEWRKPNLFRLTYRVVLKPAAPASDEWRRFQTIEEAEAARACAREGKQKPSAGKAPNEVAKSALTGATPSALKAAYSPGGEKRPTSISRDDTPSFPTTGKPAATVTTTNPLGKPEPRKSFLGTEVHPIPGTEVHPIRQIPGCRSAPPVSGAEVYPLSISWVGRGPDCSAEHDASGGQRPDPDPATALLDGTTRPARKTYR